MNVRERKPRWKKKKILYKGYFPLIRKDSSTHVPGLAVYVKEGPSLSLCTVFNSISPTKDKDLLINPLAGEPISW